MTRLTISLFCFVCCGVALNPRASGHRIISHPAESERTMRLLESPLYEGMAETVFLVDEIAKELQQLRRKGSHNEGVLHITNALEHRSNRLRPVLTEALTIVPTATPSSEDVKAFAAAIRAAQNILANLHAKASTIILEESQSPASKLLSTSPLLGHLQGALSRVQAVDPTLLNRRKPSLLEKFVVLEYIPNAEKIFSLEKELEKTSTEDVHRLLSPSSKIAFLQHRWQKAHRSLEQSARNHFNRIMQALRSTTSAGDAEDERKMTAMARFVEQASWNSVRTHLQDAARELQEITHNRIEARFKQNDSTADQPFTLPAALALVYQLHEMLPKLKEAHGRLHSLRNKLRLLSARAARQDESSMRLMQKNDAIRLRINRRALRQQSAAAVGVTAPSEEDISSLDLMKPLQRFAMLEKEVTKQGSKQRFTKELEELRCILKDIHLTAAPLRQLISAAALAHCSPSF